MSEGHEPSHLEDTPKRRWPIPKWLTFVCVLIGLLLVGFVGWRVSIRGAVDAELRAIRDRGEPTTLNELDDWYPHPQGPNLADLLLDANAVMKDLPDDPITIPTEIIAQAKAEARARAIETAIERGDGPEDYDYWIEEEPITIQHVEIDVNTSLNDLRPRSGSAIVREGDPIHPLVARAMRECVALNDQTIRKVHEASFVASGRFSWKTFNVPFFNSMYSQMRGIAYLMAEDVMWAAHQQDSGRAVDSIIAGLAVGRSFEHEPSLIAHLVRVACDASSMYAIQDALLRIDLTDEQLAQLADALEPIEYQVGMRRGMIAERAIGLHYFQNPGELSGSGHGKMGVGLKLHRAAGTIYYDQLQFVLYMNGMIAATLLPPHQQVQHINDHDDAFWQSAEKGTLYRELTRVTRKLSTALNRYVEITLFQQAELDVTRIGIAIERYRLAQGSLPGQLEQLVPIYLDALPVDPFTGKGYVYRKLKPGFVVYGLGKNRIDEGGVMYVPETNRIRPIRFEDYYTQEERSDSRYSSNHDCDITFYISR